MLTNSLRLILLSSATRKLSGYFFARLRSTCGFETDLRTLGLCAELPLDGVGGEETIGCSGIGTASIASLFGEGEVVARGRIVLPKGATFTASCNARESLRGLAGA